MNMATTRLYLAVMLVSCGMNSISQADELVTRDNFYVADETRHQWVNESNGRTGMLLVNGALLSSPCTLETNEVELPLPQQGEGKVPRYVLKLNLQGCGDGGAVAPTKSMVERDRIMVMQSALLTGVVDGALIQNQQVISTGYAVVYSGTNQFTYLLNNAQMRFLAGQNITKRAQSKHYINPRNNHVLLRLQLNYE